MHGINATAKRAMALLFSASLALSLWPVPRVARAQEVIKQEDVVDGEEPVLEDEAAIEENVEPVEDAGSDEEESVEGDVIEPADDAVAGVSAQSEEAATTKGKVAGPEPTVFLQSDAGLPSKFDLRDRGVVTPVKSQEPWGYCWAHGAIAAAETSILTAMGSTYAETGLDLSERHLAWYVANPVTEAISKSQVGEGLYVYDVDAGPNHVFDFGGREQCAATLFAQGIGPMPESDYPCRGLNGTLAYDDLIADKETYIQARIAYYKGTYTWMSDDEARPYAESDYDDAVKRYQKYDAYSPLDDWSITEPDEPGSGKLRGSAYTLTDNNVFSYWARLDDGELDAEEHFHKQPLYKTGNYVLWQDNIDQIKTELYEGHGVSTGVTISNRALNTDTWSAYDSQFSAGASHVVCIVGWDDDYAASNFKETPPGNGAWIVKNSWGSETDAVKDGLIASDGTTRDAHASEWGIVDENGKHTGYYYLSYYDGTIKAPETFSFRIEPNNDQQDALQLDYLPASVAEFGHADEQPSWEANVFTLEKDMRIDEVATRLRISDRAPLQSFTCTFNLYKLHDDATKPDDGTLLSTLTRTFQNQGYHRVALDAPIYLKAGDRLGIVVQQTYLADDGVTLYGIEAQECDGYREIHKDPVYGNAVVNEGESFFNIEGATNKEEASKDGWLDVTAPLTKEMLLYFKSDVADSPMLDYYVSHYCGKPIQSFFNIDNFSIKAFGEPVSLEHVDAVAPTCEEAGTAEYWFDAETGATYADENGTKALEDTSVAALGHDWGKARYEWTKDCSSVTATCTCKRDKSHVLTETVATQGMSNATCTRAGKVVWTAEFEGEPFSTQVKMTDEAALGHIWGKVSYTWSKDGKSCTAKRACERDSAHKQTSKAEVTSKVTKEPTATKSGTRTYTATFSASWAKAQTKTETIPALGVPTARGRAHVQKTGWTSYVAGGEIVGTTGKSQRLEALRLKLADAKVTGGIEYRGHVQGIGWEKAWARDGKTCGTTGKSKRLEAVQIRLYGQMTKKFDVYYRVHVQGYGWMAWAKNGAKAGTEGKSLRAEAVQIVIVQKGAKAPGATYNGVKQGYSKPFVTK